jgi:hypothetical protein
MDMQAELIVFSNTSKPKSEQIGLNPFHCELKKTVEENKSSAVCLIEKDWIIELRNSKEEIEFKGEKHRKKPLTYYFKKNNSKILCVDGSNYRDFSQLKRSMNDFLKNAFHNKVHSLYFIAVSKEFFAKAKGETLKTYPLSKAKRERYQNPLLNMISPEDTKIDLKERYIGNSEPCLLVRQMIAFSCTYFRRDRNRKGSSGQEHS